MPHVRQLLVNAVVTRVTGLTTTGARVFADRPEQHALDESELPCLLVYDDGEPTVEDIFLSPRAVLRTVAVRVDAVVKSVSGTSTTVRTICSEVETALGTALTVDGRPVDLLYRRTDYSPPSADADRPVGRVSLFFEAQLATAAAAPDALISY